MADAAATALNVFHEKLRATDCCFRITTMTTIGTAEQLMTTAIHMTLIFPLCK
jgi:hypothetical protein